MGIDYLYIPHNINNILLTVNKSNAIKCEILSGVKIKILITNLQNIILKTMVK